MTEVGEVTAPRLRSLLTGAPVAGMTLPGGEWTALLGSARREQLVGALALAVVEDRLEVSEQQWAELTDALARQNEATVALESFGLHLIDHLRAAGVHPAVLKGLATAHLDHVAAWARPFGDVDLLVRPHELDAAYEVLTALGLRRRYPEPAPGFDRRFGKGTSFRAPDGREVDLHRTLTAGALGLSIDLDELWADLDEVHIAGRTVPALGLERRVLHLCLHLAASRRAPKPTSLHDLVVLGARPDLDLEVTAALARHWRFELVVVEALALVERHAFAGTRRFLSELADRCRPRRRDRIVLRAYTAPGAGYALQSIVGITALEGWRDRAAYVGALARPSAAYRRRQGPTGGNRFRRAARQLPALAGRRRRGAGRRRAGDRPTEDPGTGDRQAGDR